jgi:NCS1 family nucleobase:cation symporter-1
MGAIGGIMICDYWVLRRQRLALRELFDPRGRYSYTNGINWRALVALVVAIAPCVPGFVHAATTPGGNIPPEERTFMDVIYTYAWFITFAIGFILYGVLMIGHPNTRQET